MDDYNTEENAGLFGNIAVSLNKDDNLMEIFEQFKAIVTEISEADYRKIAYVVANTRFEFDGIGEEWFGEEYDHSEMDYLTNDTDKIDEEDEDLNKNWIIT